MRSYDAVLAEIPALLTLLDDENPRVRTRTAYLLAWFPELADTSLPLLLDVVAHEHDAVAKATSLVAVGILGTSSLAGTLAVDLDAEDSLAPRRRREGSCRGRRSAPLRRHDPINGVPETPRKSPNRNHRKGNV